MQGVEQLDTGLDPRHRAGFSWSVWTEYLGLRVSVRFTAGWIVSLTGLIQVVESNLLLVIDKYPGDYDCASADCGVFREILFLLLYFQQNVVYPDPLCINTCQF